MAQHRAELRRIVASVGLWGSVMIGVLLLGRRWLSESSRSHNSGAILARSVYKFQEEAESWPHAMFEAVAGGVRVIAGEAGAGQSSIRFQSCTGGELATSR